MKKCRKTTDMEPMDTVYRKFQSRKGQGGAQSGQAVIEYLLILIVVVGIILGGLYQLNTAFKVWANNYFGNYLTCLLETGELPALGGDTTVSDCNKQFQAFSLAEGRPLIGKPLGEGGEDGDAGGPKSGKDGESVQPSSGGAGVSDGGVPAGSSRRMSSLGLPSRFRARRGGTGAEEGSGINREDVSSSGGSYGGDYENGRPRRIALERDFRSRRGYGDDEDKKTKNKTKAKNVEKGTEQVSGPKLIPINSRQVASAEEPDIQPFTFGSFLRYLIIAAIVIAVIIFIGGQALQVSKSLD